jgi:hypothetical protein
MTTQDFGRLVTATDGKHLESEHSETASEFAELFQSD